MMRIEVHRQQQRVAREAASWSRFITATLLISLGCADLAFPADGIARMEGRWGGVFRAAPEVRLLPGRTYEFEMEIRGAGNGEIRSMLYAPCWGEKEWPLEVNLEGSELSLRIAKTGRNSGVFHLISQPDGT